MMRWPTLCAIVAILESSHTPAFAATGEPASTGTDTPPSIAKETDGKTWAFSASAYAYFVPDSRNYVQPTVTADRRWLHLEARYNYEGLDTGSAWVGYNFHVGEKLSLDFTPMLGDEDEPTVVVADGVDF